MAGISLWYPVEVGRRVRIWHHSGIILSARDHRRRCAAAPEHHHGHSAATDRLGELPIIEPGVDIGAGAVIVGAVVVGQGARIGANAVVTQDVPPGGSAVGNPAQILPPRPEAADPTAAG
jgi:serine O-acetyltransferase